MRIRSYRALRPVPALASRIASLPYDVVSTAESRALVAGNPDSMLRIARSDLEFPDDTDPYSEPVYAKAKTNWDRLVREQRLVKEDAASLYVYRQQMGQHVQTGVAALCHVDDYDAGLIKKHEKTRKDKEDDRVRHTSTLSANPGPVFLTYRGQAAIDALVTQATAGAPLIDFTAHTGVRHSIWRIAAPAALVAAFAAVPCTYIADGHHRAASAARVARERRAANPQHTGTEDYNWFLTVLFPAEQLRILPYNRLVVDLNGRTSAQFLAELGKAGVVSVESTSEPAAPGDVRVYLDGRWHGLSLTPAADADPVSRLDVSLLQDRVLAPMLAIDDPRTSKRIDFVGGIRGTKFLEDAVNAGRAKVAFSLHAVTIEQLMDIADAGQIMPPKSTWFEPKLLDGLFMHTF
ncbi:MAG: DUF1015 domain-containing protein [Opitutaceae bacterium]|nr:DUF1015 domain-containing protein [Opitutaceae bacterium]